MFLHPVFLSRYIHNIVPNHSAYIMRYFNDMNYPSIFAHDKAYHVMLSTLPAHICIELVLVEWWGCVEIFYKYYEGQISQVRYL